MLFAETTDQKTDEVIKSCSNHSKSPVIRVKTNINLQTKQEQSSGVGT